MQPTEIDLLAVYVGRMESEGKNRELVRLGVNGDLLNHFTAQGFNTDLEHLQKLADLCLAREWLEHKALGGKYACLGLTSTGVGVVLSRRAQKSRLAGRSPLKKASDFVEEHKGIFIALGAGIAIFGLLIKVLGS